MRIRMDAILEVTRVASPDGKAWNKKYLCAIGNSFAGSQVSNTPHGSH
jgi:hypothetical protein